MYILTRHSLSKLYTIPNRTYISHSRGVEDEVGVPIKPALLSPFIDDFKNNSFTINNAFFSMNSPIHVRNKFTVTVNVTNGDSATGRFDILLKVN